MTNAEAGSRTVQAGDAAFSYLDAGSSPPLVLLHGIGSAAGSFRCQVETLCPRLRVIAWDAPGYGASTRLATEHPHDMLGHSLGTLIAARFAAEQPKRVLSLTLASIASGHGRLPPAERQRLLAQRLDFARMSILDGASAWSEHDWIGSDITLGAARLRVILPITRCAATQVNPVTARRDLDIVAALGRAFGHINMGVYAEVVAPTRSPSAMRCSSRKGIRRAVDTIYLNISKGPCRLTLSRLERGGASSERGTRSPTCGRRDAGAAPYFFLAAAIVQVLAIGAFLSGRQQKVEL